jgi:3-dehydroquinate synthetase/predicted O-methyltransferase YrrM
MVSTTTVHSQVQITRGVFDIQNDLLAKRYVDFGRKRVVCVIDANVPCEHQLHEYCKHHCIALKTLTIECTEADKDCDSVLFLLRKFKEFNMYRDEPLLVIGGGVISDIAGLACAMYHRNVPYIMVNTSLVAAVDAGPSPRTCCDYGGYKNLFGSYHPPVLSIVDRSLFYSLPSWAVRHGMAEIVKVAVVKDESLFHMIQCYGECCVETKFGAVTDIKNDVYNDILLASIHMYTTSEHINMTETHQHRAHAYGHTWSPGYEIDSGLLHGHAVSTDMCFSAFLSMELGWIAMPVFKSIYDLCVQLKLSTWCDLSLDVSTMLKATKNIRAKRGGCLHVPLPRGKIGNCDFLVDISDKQLCHVLSKYKEFVQANPHQPQSFKCPNPAAASSAPLTLLPKRISQYCSKLSMPESESMRQVIDSTKERNGLDPSWAVGSLEGSFLRIMARHCRISRVLDIGTYNGYSAACFASEKNVTVTSWENDRDRGNFAKKLLSECPDVQIDVVNAVEKLSNPPDDLEPYDIVFINGAKEEYVDYYQLLMKNKWIRNGSLILAGNTLGSMLYLPGDQRKEKIHAFNEMVASDPRVEQVLLPIREGLSIISIVNTD